MSKITERKKVEKAVKDLVEEDVEEYQQDYSDMSSLPPCALRSLVLVTEGEAKLLVKCAGNTDGDSRLSYDEFLAIVPKDMKSTTSGAELTVDSVAYSE